MALVYLTNSYLADADDYLADVPDWEAATLAQQEQALIDATTLLDETPWIGSAVSATQSLGWPREVSSFYDPVLNLEVPVSSSEIPVRLEKATAYLALHLIRYPSVITGQYDQAYSSINVGPISLSNSTTAVNPPRVPMQIVTLIAPLSRDAETRHNWWRTN